MRLIQPCNENAYENEKKHNFRRTLASCLTADTRKGMEDVAKGRR